MHLIREYLNTRSKYFLFPFTSNYQILRIISFLDCFNSINLQISSLPYLGIENVERVIKKKFRRHFLQHPIYIQLSAMMK